ncbi:peptidylprolyl isomerase [Eremococcus coleocola]|uniref:Foldase protein PrsA n=1 Tax=Eremococcus coleocola ACS-139-V-Col8 TaxID=908337 RepID=E4KQ79_9LACT|nr:peptidylprolyl isomerase [Eremococcus coleocola]EFR30839.1 peptidylprolyl isomerase [Eremococcus coleocola ACS-139-V-Col8]
MKKALLKTIGLSFTSLALASSLAGALPVMAQDDVIATIGDTKITKEDFYNEMKSLAGKTTLRSMILENVLKQNVKDADALKKSADEEAQEQLDKVGEDQFNAYLNQMQLGSIDEFKYQLYIRNMFQEVVEGKMDLSDEAIKKFYDESYETPMEAQQILVKTEDEAKDVINRLNNGEEFDALAKELSIDEATAANGGLLSPFTSGQMVQEFEDAVKASENGSVTQEPVKSQYGFHVIKTINNGTKQAFEDVKDDVVNQYKQSKFSDSNFSYGVIGQLIKDAKVDIKDKDLKDAVTDLTQLTEQTAESTEAASSAEGE